MKEICPNCNGKYKKHDDLFCCLRCYIKKTIHNLIINVHADNNSRGGRGLVLAQQRGGRGQTLPPPQPHPINHHNHSVYHPCNNDIFAQCSRRSQQSSSSTSTSESRSSIHSISTGERSWKNNVVKKDESIKHTTITAQLLKDHKKEEEDGMLFGDVDEEVETIILTIPMVAVAVGDDDGNVVGASILVDDSVEIESSASNTIPAPWASFGDVGGGGGGTKKASKSIKSLSEKSVDLS